jgi:protein involved in polysaccharide export with SLBB domain
MPRISIAFIACFLFMSTLSAQEVSVKMEPSGTSVTPNPAPIKPDSTLHSSQSDSLSRKSPYPFPYFNEGDAIKITIFPDSSLFLNGFYTIDKSGYVDLPILGLVPIKGKTRNEFIDFLKKEYSDYLRYPNINVSSYMRVSFFGGFYRPGLYWVENRNSLWDAMQLAGGVNREDGLKMIRWERDGKVISYNVIQDFQSGNSLQSMGFKSGDQLCVTFKPKEQFWDTFRQEVLPLFAFTLSSLTTAASLYQAYRIYTRE